MNNKVLELFQSLAKKDTVNKYTVKLSKKNDFTAYDRQFIKNFLGKNTEWLDIGSGTGLGINGFSNHVKKIVAIEPFQEFSAFIEKAENVYIVNETFANFRPDNNTGNCFDLITCFGLCNLLNSHEAKELYKKYYPLLKSGGKFIVKNQFGVNEDVIIDKFSEELQSMYYSEYRTLEHEKKLMAKAGFKNFAVTDIYSPECNRWDNTHYFAIVAEK